MSVKNRGQYKKINMENICIPLIFIICIYIIYIYIPCLLYSYSSDVYMYITYIYVYKTVCVCVYTLYFFSDNGFDKGKREQRRSLMFLDVKSCCRP